GQDVRALDAAADGQAGDGEIGHVRRRGPTLGRDDDRGDVPEGRALGADQIPLDGDRPNVVGRANGSALNQGVVDRVLVIVGTGPHRPTDEHAGDPPAMAVAGPRDATVRAVAADQVTPDAYRAHVAVAFDSSRNVLLGADDRPPDGDPGQVAIAADAAAVA